jgi:DnaK suppressor protein
VQHALGRLGSDSFDKCIVCGNPIETARLKAIPWTLYCLEDQQKRDLKKSPAKQYPDEFTYSQSA